MPRQPKPKEKSRQSTVPSPFHLRFDIQVDMEQAQQHFINRIENQLSVDFPTVANGTTSGDWVLRQVASALGAIHISAAPFKYYVKRDFLQCLHALEAMYQAIAASYESAKLNMLVETVISQSEVDLGISWENGTFRRSGAKLLDEELVNEPLQWLSDPNYKSVLTPLKKGVTDFLETNKYPGKLVDTIRDMYEALEKMARIVNGNNKNLKANAEQFVSKLGLSTHYSKMLKDYTEFANEFRHAVEEGKERTPPAPQEVEAFVYTTGIFIRLAIESQP